MRLHSALLLPLLAAAPPIAAQMATDYTGWRLGGGVEAVRFGHVAVTEAAPGVAAEVRPSGRPALYLSGGRNYGSWGVDLEAGWAGGHIEAGNDALSIQDRTSDVSRYRLAIGLARSVASAGGGTIAIVLAPTLDLWDVAGESRVRAGVEGRLALRVPLGAVELENRIGVGLSGSPIQAVDIGEVSNLRGLRTLLVGMGLRFRLGARRAPSQAATRLPHPSQNLLSDERVVPQRAQVAGAGSLPPQLEQNRASGSGRGPHEGQAETPGAVVAEAKRRSCTL